MLYLRGNTLIDYEQLGLKFRLYSCEVLFNRGLCFIYDGRVDEGMQDLEYASKEVQVEDHNVINEAIAEKAEVSGKNRLSRRINAKKVLRTTPFSRYQLELYTDPMRPK